MKKFKLILLAAFMCAPVFTHGATVISSVPYTISAPGAYALGNNLTAQGTNGIVINASNVSIDLGGSTLSQSQAGNGVGIVVSSGMSNVSVQNGTITGFGFGVAFESGSGDSLTNVQVLNIGSIGLYVLANNCLVENCIMVGATGASETGIYIYNCGAVGVRNNQISKCYYGIYLSAATSPSALIGNYEASCAYGLYLEDPKSKYQGNVTTNCTTPVSGGIAVGQENG